MYECMLGLSVSWSPCLGFGEDITSNIHLNIQQSGNSISLLLKIWSYIYIDNALFPYMVRRGKKVMYGRSKKGSLTIAVRN